MLPLTISDRPVTTTNQTSSDPSDGSTKTSYTAFTDAGKLLRIVELCFTLKSASISFKSISL